MEPNNIPTSDIKNKVTGTPKKFIRTFLGDMDVFQKGGVPDLAPFEEKEEQTPSERLIEASPISRVPVPPVPLPTVPQKDVSSAPVPLSPKPVVEPPKPVVDPAPVPLKTYASDFKDRMTETHSSTATVIAAEQDAHVESPVIEKKPIEDSKNGWYIGGGVLLLLLGVVGVGFSYARYRATNAPIFVTPIANAPIFVDTQEEVRGTGLTLQQAIKESTKKPLVAGTVRLLTLAQDGDTTLFSELSPRVPGILVRNIDSTRSMAGIVNVSTGQSPFFILSVEAYSATFSGMLQWEPVMQSDLALIFPIPVVPTATASSTVATTTKVATVLPRSVGPKSNFRDEVVSNHDVRVYRDTQGKSVLLYGYWNQQTLVIARDPAAFTQVIERLATAHDR